LTSPPLSTLLVHTAQMVQGVLVGRSLTELLGSVPGEARPGTLEMVILEPIQTDGLSTDEDVERLIKEVHSRIAEELYAEPRQR
jgi:hypothetical protein